MRHALLAMTAVLAFSCGQSGPSAAGPSPTPRASPSAAATASPVSSPSPTTLTSSYGLLLSAGNLELINTAGGIAASASVAAPSVQYCSSAHDGAILQPPVSATSDQVFFRDGDTKIRYLTPSGQTGDATTVPGGPNTVSFFAVSPDDQRIVALVEDLSGTDTITLRLYVEDLHGGGHHSDIYSTTTPKGKGGSTLWPMGWHQGQLVLAVVTACTFEPAGLSPSSWHVSDAASANRIATIGGNCILSYWPSPAGVACVDSSKLQASTYDWSGKLTGNISTGSDDYQSGLSPSGTRIFFATGQGIGAPPPATRVLTIGATTAMPVAGHTACLWIDDSHLLAPDAVIEYPSSVVTPLAASGVCAGRLPGGL